jgi:S-adenosylmethionine:tRNA ribosyltransferase-isomerase
LLVFDSTSGAHVDVTARELAHCIPAGSLLVVNDAATLPASLRAKTEDDRALELRLLGAPERGHVRAVLFGDGDYRTPTELRAPPPRLAPGARLHAGALQATVREVSALSPRLVTLELRAAQGGSLWSALYAAGRPVQYAHHDQDLELWSFQTLYAGRPWAAEMPSAGRPLSAAALLQLRRAGVALARLTHAAGLSATGDPALDRALPLAEAYDIPEHTVAAVEHTRAAGGQVIAAGTTVVRALEGCAAAHAGRLAAGRGETALIVDAGHRLQVVHGLISGLHAPEESHHKLLEAFMLPAQLRTLDRLVVENGYHDHELGDICLLYPGALAAPQPVACTPTIECMQI